MESGRECGEDGDIVGYVQSFSFCLLTNGVKEVTEMACKFDRSKAKKKDTFSK